MRWLYSFVGGVVAPVIQDGNPIPARAYGANSSRRLSRGGPIGAGWLGVVAIIAIYVSMAYPPGSASMMEAGALTEQSQWHRQCATPATDALLAASLSRNGHSAPAGRRAWGAGWQARPPRFSWLCARLPG